MRTILLGLFLCMMVGAAQARTVSPGARSAEAVATGSTDSLDGLLPVRGFCIAAPRPSGLDSFLVFVRKELAPRHVNTLILRIDYHYAFQSHPELQDSFALSRKDVKEIVRVCREHGIRIIPQINLLGHQSDRNHLGKLLQVYPQFDETPGVSMPLVYSWPNPDNLYCKSYCPLDPDVHKVVFEVIDEICDVFEADAFHAGMDEVFYLGEPTCPRCAGRDKAELFAGEVKAVHDHLAASGRSLWIWGDRLLDGRTTGVGEWEGSYNNTYRAIDLIPKDVTICDWHYERADYTAVYFAMKGFRVITCPWRRPTIATIQLRDMLNFRNQSSWEMKDRFQGMAETVWSNTAMFLRGFYGQPLPPPPPGFQPGDPTETPWNCFRVLYDSIGALSAGADHPVSVSAWRVTPVALRENAPRKVAAAAPLTVSPVRSIDPADTDYSDLAALGNAIGSARIVLLGEQTHGEGSTFEAKTRLVKFLHERMGFEVLAFESGLYDCARIWENVGQGDTLSKEVIGSLFYMYATSVQTKDLFAYVQGALHSARPLMLTGFESQHTGQKSKTQLFDDFSAFLSKRHPELLDSNFALFRRLSLATFASNAFRPAPADQTAFLMEMRLLIAKLSDNSQVTGPLTDAPGFWYQVVRSIQSQVLRYWQLTKENPNSVRDAQMSENLIWLAEKAYPGKKIIVWAHNGHIAKDWSTLAPVNGPAPPASAITVPMGNGIHRHFGHQAYAIGFSGEEGKYMDYVNSAIVTVAPRSAGSIEDQMSKAGYKYAFTDFHHAPENLETPQIGSLGDYGELKGVWPAIFDGFFLIHTVYPVERFQP